jgi:hypothetical protein
MTLDTIFKQDKPIIGMIHVGALPGAPASEKSVAEITRDALAEATVYLTAGVDGLLLENMRDLPYLCGEVGPEITASLAIIAERVKSSCDVPVGLQILAAANREALAVAYAAGLDFIRAEGFAFAHVADEGIIQACAGPLLRYRKALGAERVQIWADIKKKHSAHALTADVSLGETAEAVEFMRGDAVIVTGGATGRAARLEDVAEAKKHCRLPVLLGSGVDAENLAQYYHKADGFIVGSHFKREGFWRNPLDADRIERFMQEAARLRLVG